MKKTIGSTAKQHFTLSDIPDNDVTETVKRYIYLKENETGQKAEQWGILMFGKYTQEEIQTEYTRQKLGKKL